MGEIYFCSDFAETWYEGQIWGPDFKFQLQNLTEVSFSNKIEKFVSFYLFRSR